MKKLTSKLRIVRNTSGQNLIDYALLAGFMALTGSAILPGVAASVSTIFSQVGTVMVSATSQDGGQSGPVSQSTGIPTP